MSEDHQWNARVFSEKVLKKAVQGEICKLALVVLGNHKLSIEYSKEGFDNYPYCKHSTKQFCPVGSKRMHYKGSWRQYVVFGHTRTDVYLEVLRCLANDNSVYTPIVSYRRNDEWIEVEEYKKLSDEFEKMKEKIITGLGIPKEYLTERED